MAKRKYGVFADFWNAVSLVVGIGALIVVLVVLLAFLKVLSFFLNLSGNTQLILSIFCIGGVLVFAAIIAVAVVVAKLRK